MIAVLFASHFNAKFEWVTGILDKQGIPYRAYGGTNVFKGLMEKLEVAQQAANELDDEHILFLDAYDIICLAGPDEIMERFETFDHPWVCNAEPNIWPLRSFLPENYPKIDSPWKYLNSGAYLAERVYMKACFDRWTDNGTKPITHSLHNDQPWLAARFLEEPGVIKLDYECVLFQCLIGADWALEHQGGRTYNKDRGTTL